MALIKTEILTSSKVLYTKSCKSNQFLFFFLVFLFSRNIYRSETGHLLLRIILESFFLTSNTCDEHFALQTQIRSDASSC